VKSLQLRERKQIAESRKYYLVCDYFLWQIFFSTFASHKSKNFIYIPYKAVMWDGEASKNKIHLLLENKKQNTFAFENNIELARVPWIHKEKEF